MRQMVTKCSKQMSSNGSLPLALLSCRPSINLLVPGLDVNPVYACLAGGMSITIEELDVMATAQAIEIWDEPD